MYDPVDKPWWAHYNPSMTPVPFMNQNLQIEQMNFFETQFLWLKGSTAGIKSSIVPFNITVCGYYPVIPTSSAPSNVFYLSELKESPTGNSIQLHS